jgi:ADP-dependent NAD(P)H-hydrate dehydratase / NAD(P)H-hydrate epimerase
VSGELITVAQMRAIDAASAAAGVATRSLMENAGRAVAEAVRARFSPRPLAVLCGPGNNGGDGWIAACALLEAGWPVSVETLVSRAHLQGDAAAAAGQWRGDVAALGAGGLSAELYIDALFGAGLSRPLDGESERLARVLPPERVVAVDVPSGLAGDTGAALGQVCFRAALTVTFVRKKPAHVLMPGRAYCGEIVVADIGAPASALAAQNIALWENGVSRWRFPWPDPQSHKHARGHVMVASGGHGRTGAARLAARAALRVGAGLVSVLSPAEAMAENAAQLTAIMLTQADAPTAYAQAATRAQCLLIGPGLGAGPEHAALLAGALQAKGRCPLVLDADAITLLAPIGTTLDERDVLTPHVGEFKRAFPNLLETAPSRIEAARAAAARAGCVALLKGPDTVIAAPDGRAIVNTTGTPFLATAGSGDVLAGLIAGLIGQGMASFEAAAVGAWLHGKLGERCGAGLIAEDLPENLSHILNALAWTARGADWGE